MMKDIYTAVGPDDKMRLLILRAATNHTDSYGPFATWEALSAKQQEVAPDAVGVTPYRFEKERRAI